MKGSTVDREASEKELEKRLPTLKDNDFIKQGVKITIGEEAKTKFLDSLNADVNVSYTAESRKKFFNNTKIKSLLTVPYKTAFDGLLTSPWHS